MIIRQGLFIGTCVFLAVLFELTLLSRLGIPGATPDLVVVTVVAIAFAMGPLQGAMAGFAAGVLIDLSPSSDTLVGVNAIIYLVIGFVAGFWVDPRDRTLPIMIGITALSTGAAALGTAIVDTALGSDRVNWAEVPWITLSSALYGVLLSALVIPLIDRISRPFVSEIAIS
ncbi:MAG: rod shape-determining protein MreD [Candidatus Nanopelagicales bacterium]|nr:rod shape-determining protein MreD [Actinomycetes bacterium]